MTKRPSNPQQPPPVPPVPPNADKAGKRLPYSNWWPIVGGAVLGLSLRLVFSGKPGGPYSVMLLSFVLMVPLAVGAVTVYLAEQQRPRHWTYWLGAPVIANAMFVLSTLAILIEGLICVVVILPLFCAAGAVGGLLMGLVCRWSRRLRSPAAFSFALLPLLLGGLPVDEAGERRVGRIERSVVVEASPEQIWAQIHDTRGIDPKEVGHAWMYRIGVPPPISGVTEDTPEGRVRKVTMGKSIQFDQVAAEWEENRKVRWTYRFTPDSFPPRALDDHVLIGGQYFDLIDTVYTLKPLDATRTELKISMGYRVSTQFNWYADGVAKLLIGNFEDVILGFYRERAVRVAGLQSLP